MNKIGIIFSREYLSRVKKKSFLLTTIGVPLVIMVFYALIIYLSLSDSDEKQKIAVIDEAGLLSTITDRPKSSTELVFIKNESEASFLKKYKTDGYDYFLYISNDSTSKKRYHLHSSSAASLTTMSDIEDLINNAVRNKQLIANGVDPQFFDKATAEVELENTIDTEKGARQNFAGISYAVSFGCGFLIYMMMVIYGTQVMRGVTEEKTNRVAEVMVSSVKPFQLMMGKILGIGAVGLTQFGIWIILLLSMQSILPFLFPDLMQQVSSGAVEGQSEKMAVVAEVFNGFSSLPITKIILSFVFYFLGGFLTYASIFAAVGSVVSEDQQEAQQLVFPVLMPIIIGFVIMSKAVNDPNSTEAVFGSIFPLTSPIVMMGRITYDVPLWQMATSMLLLVLSFFFFTWITAKIYRTGILMYGKRPGWKEMIKWGFRKS